MKMRTKKEEKKKKLIERERRKEAKYIKSILSSTFEVF
jgi:hypothetical protein